MAHSQSELFLMSLLDCFLLLTAIAMASAATNETYVKEICSSKTSWPKECWQCTLSDRSRASDATPELIHSLMFCMYSEATHAQVNADLLSQNTTDPTLKSALSQCSSSLFDAANQAIDAWVSIEGKVYQQAWDQAKNAKQLLSKCEEVLGESIPPSVLEHWVPAERLVNDADALFPLIVH